MSDLIVRGRYQIVPKGGNKPKAYTRVTNFAKKLEDGYTLTEWKLRNVVLGTALRTDIVASAVAASADLAGDQAAQKRAKQTLGNLAKQALDAAKANVGRETGTALHTLTEHVDRGTAVDMPSPIREDLSAYTACMDVLGAKVLRMEEVIVHNGLGLAGRFDRIVEIDGTSYIMDLKTGADLSYSWLSIAIQLAIYAGASSIYHHEEGDRESCSHEPMPAVDQSRALVVHLPAGQAKATPYWVDLDVGRRGIALVDQVQEWRKIKDTAHEIVDISVAFPDAVEVESATLADVRDWAHARILAIVGAGHGSDLAHRWPFDIPTLKASDEHTEAQYDEILAACTVVEGLHTMPFPDSSDPRLRDQQPKATKKRGSK